jgi:hypothetical protein
MRLSTKSFGEHRDHSRPLLLRIESGSLLLEKHWMIGDGPTGNWSKGFTICACVQICQFLLQTAKTPNHRRHTKCRQPE